MGILHPRTGATNGGGDGTDGFMLADYAVVQVGFELEELLAFGGQQAVDGDARPFGDDFGDIVVRNLFAEQRGALDLDGGEFGFFDFPLLLEFFVDRSRP